MYQNYRRPFGLVLSFLLLTVTGINALAQPAGYAIGLALTPLSTFDSTHVDYLPADQRFRVRGTFTLPPGVASTDFEVRVQGNWTTFTPMGGNVYSFERTVPVGPTAPPGGWQYYAFGSSLRAPDHIAKPILAELVHIGKQEVFGRHLVVIFDKRTDESLNPQYMGGTVNSALATELTGTGLDALEPLHRSVLPQPSNSSFDTVLTNNFRNFNRTVSMDTSLGNLASPANQTPKACMPVPDAPAEFRATSAWTSIMTEATTAYTAYLAAKELQSNGGSISAAIAAGFPPALLLTIALAGGTQAVIDSACVTKPPLARHFELCASSMRGDARTLALANVSSADLALGAAGSSPPAITAMNRLGRLDSTVDGKIQNFFFRYAEDPSGGCLARPRVSLSESIVGANVVMNNWRICQALEFDALAPRATNPIEYQLNGQTDEERNRPEVLSSPTPLFNLGPNLSTSPDKGTCQVTGFRHNAESLLSMFSTRARTALDAAWVNGSPRTQQADGLDLVFSRWETGIFGDANLAGTPTGADLQMTHKYKPLASQNFSDRIFTQYSTDAKAIGVVAPAWMYTTPGAFPCRTAQQPCLNNATIFNQPFDTSYSVTTNALNQVVKELAATSLLTFNWQPTYDELGVNPPQGGAATDVAVLNGPTLAQLHGSFGVLGNTVLAIRITPTMPPYTFINPDPSNVLTGRAPLTYQTTQLKMELTSSTISPLGDNTWLSLLIDHYDPELNLNPSVPRSLNVLTPAFSGQQGSTATVVRNGFHVSGCTMATVLPPEQPPPPQPQIAYPNCANVMGSRLMSAFRPLLEQRLLYLLSRFPAPLRWNADGQGSGAVEWSSVDKYQWQNVITFYGRLQ